MIETAQMTGAASQTGASIAYCRAYYHALLTTRVESHRRLEAIRTERRR